MSLITLNGRPAVSDEQQYRLLFVVAFPFFLAAAAAHRIWRAGRQLSGEAPRSMIAEARDASANALLLAFQG